ncbi:hypothetical protein ABT173_32380 [Streptomyces sp. NPDC001795]|uniref:hypothetical protein n=1 Tax=Streptomyces sp. NPDC001795 TaxID=3154525 RepID=UPI0033321816
MPRGSEVGYRAFSVNGRTLGHGWPIKVKTGQRVLFHVLNAGATEIRSLALPGHTFQVVALDGNPVPRRANVPVVWIGTAERVSPLVEMNHRGVWVRLRHPAARPHDRPAGGETQRSRQGIRHPAPQRCHVLRGHRQAGAGRRAR